MAKPKVWRPKVGDKVWVEATVLEVPEYRLGMHHVKALEFPIISEIRRMTDRERSKLGNNNFRAHGT